MNSLRKSKREREPENVPGPFYVAKGECIICMLPVESAPDLMGYHNDPSGKNANSHCYFKKQPVTPDEIALAVEIIDYACCGALRYCGSDQTIIDKILKGNNPDSADYSC